MRHSTTPILGVLESSTRGSTVSPIEPSQTSGPSAFLLTIGDIGVTDRWVSTPNGHAPLRGSQWIAADMSTTQRRIPTWAIVLAVLFALFFLIGLLFLLVREEVTRGYVQVSVRSGDLNHMTQLPVTSPQDVARIRGLVAHAQALAAQAPAV